MSAPIITEAESSTSMRALSRMTIQGTPILTGAAIATGCVYIALNDPETQQVFPVCGFYSMTGLYCPGCGMTRALHNVVTGNIFRAVRFNALLVIAIPILMYLYVWWVTWALSGKELPTIKFSKKMLVIAFTFLAVFIIGRNLPGSIPEYFSLGRV